MSAAEVRSDYKVTVSGSDHLTAEVLDGAINELYGRGVPGWASITVNQSMSGNRWAVMAKWDPSDEPTRTEDAAPISASANLDAAVSAAAATQRVRAIQKRIQDAGIDGYVD